MATSPQKNQEAIESYSGINRNRSTEMMPQFGLKVNNSNGDMSNYRTVAQDQRQSKVMSTFSSSSLRKLS